MYLKYNYNYYLCSKFIINNLCPVNFKLAIIKSNEVWNLFDPNGSHLYYSNIMNSEEYQEIINKTVGENVNILFHKNLNNTSELNWFSFDKGLCGVWCILLLHMLYLCPDKKVIEVIDFFTSMDAFTRAITIYSYCCGIFHIPQQLQYIVIVVGYFIS
jgi:hypothetical protein